MLDGAWHGVAWHYYLAGILTHFDALRNVFMKNFGVDIGGIK